MNSGHKISGQFVIARCDAAKVFEPAEAPLDDIAPFIGLFVEAVEHDTVGFVGNDGRGAVFADAGAKGITIVALVGDQLTHGRRLRQHVGRSRDVGVLARRQVQDDRTALWVGQSMDFRRASASRAPDRLCVFPPFPPEALR